MPKSLITHYDRASLCYYLAYFLLPRYIADNPRQLLGHLERDPDYAAKFLCFMACEMSGHEPNGEDVRAMTGHVGQLADGWNYNIIGYPKFPRVNLLAALQKGEKPAGDVVLAPYFSAILFREPGKIEYSTVLGQTPSAGTTFRQVTRESNANLGPGCEPTLAAFVALLQNNLKDGKLPERIAAVVRPSQDKRRHAVARSLSAHRDERLVMPHGPGQLLFSSAV